MKFRTELNIDKADFEISHKDKLMFIGSCFSHNIGSKFEALKFDININPNGIIFNPISICNTLNNVIDNCKLEAKDVVENNELYHSFLHHGSFSRLTYKELEGKVNKSTEIAHNFLKNAKVLFVTFGSAFTYLYKDGVVANCHKIPQSKFIKRILEVPEIVESFSLVLNKLKIFNPNLKVVFTVSPVRHVKDGIVENNLSKSTLLLAINKLEKANLNCSYFPSYELVLDDLRDYRFYNEDLIHPNNKAVSYIWDKIELTYFNRETLALTKEIKSLVQAKNHKLLHPETEQSKKFVSNTRNKLQAFKNKTGIEI